MLYNYKVFTSFNEFYTAHPDVAICLKEEVGDGEWMEGEIYYYPTKEDFCEYELIDGWYTGLNFDTDFRGAPNPMDYIDYERFAKALIDTWDSRCNWTDGVCVVTTTDGW